MTEKSHMYCMLLLKLGCKVSGYHLNSHMTAAQLPAANTGQALSFSVRLIRSIRSESPPAFRLICLTTPRPSETANLAQAKTTLANT